MSTMKFSGTNFKKTNPHIDTHKDYYVKYWLNEDTRLHRDDGPAVITYTLDHKIKREAYYKNGLYYREDGPAIIIYNKVGKIIEKFYFCNREFRTLKELKTYVKTLILE